MRPHTSRCSATSTCTRRPLSESRDSRQSATTIHGRSSRPSRPSRTDRLDPAVECRPFATRCYALVESNLCPPMKDSSSHLSLQKTTAQTALHVAAASTILGEVSRTAPQKPGEERCSPHTWRARQRVRHEADKARRHSPPKTAGVVVAPREAPVVRHPAALPSRLPCDALAYACASLCAPPLGTKPSRHLK